MKTVDKPWGREIWVAHTDKYAFKIIGWHALRNEGRGDSAKHALRCAQGVPP